MWLILANCKTKQGTFSFYEQEIFDFLVIVTSRDKFVKKYLKTSFTLSHICLEIFIQWEFLGYSFQSLHGGFVQI